MKKSLPVLELNATVADLNQIRDFLTAESAPFHMSEDSLYDMLLAVTEMATNSMVHGYKGKPGFLEISLAEENGKVMVYLRDHAPLFDPTKAPPPDLKRPFEHRKMGGLGIFLTKEMVEELRYKPLPGGGNETILIIRKQNRPKEARS